MRYAIVKNGVVVNVAESETALEPNWLQDDLAQIGWLHDGEIFTPPPPAEAPPVDLPALKVAANLAINAWREKANFSVFPHNGKLIACDQLSRSDIDAVAGHISLFGTLPPDFPGAWKYTDNSLLYPMGVDEFKAMYTSMTAQGTTNFAHSQSLKAQVAAAATAEQVNDILASL